MRQYKKKLTKKQKNKLLNSLLVIAIVIALRFFQNYLGIEPYVDKKEGVAFTRCVDGDTARFTIDGVEERVRFIAVDTPELSKKDYYAIEARDYTCDVLDRAQNIELVFDPKADDRDKYGRMIAWVYADGVLLQESLVAQGYARVHYIYDDYMFVDLLYEKQNEAKKQKLGIWK